MRYFLTLIFAFALVGCDPAVDALSDIESHGRTTGGTAGNGEETVVLTSGYQRVVEMPECSGYTIHEKFGRTTGGTAGGREETVILTSGYQRTLQMGGSTHIDPCASGPQVRHMLSAGRTTGGTAGGREETVILTSGYE